MLTTIAVTALALAGFFLWALPLRRVRLATTGMLCIIGGSTAFTCLLDQYLHGTPLDGLLRGKVAQASSPATLPAEAETTAEAPVTVGSELPENPAEAPEEPADLVPVGAVIYPDDRPAWVEGDFAHLTGDVQQLAVSSGPFAKKQEALRALDDELLEATQLYVSEYLGNRSAGTLVPVDLHYIKQRLIKPGHLYSERIVVSVGPMHQVHALLEFDNSFRHDLDQRWETIVQTGRVLKLGVIGAGVLMGLSVLFGFFKADTATRGYYTSRLQFASATALLAVVGAGFLLFKYL